MKKLLTLGILTFGVMAVAKAPAMANDYFTSTAAASFISFVTTATDPSRAPIVAGGLTASGSVDITRVYTSTGYNNGAWLVCADTLPLTAQSGGAATFAVSFASIDNSQYLFPPIYFIPSSATVQGMGGTILDMRDMQGGGRTIKSGITCFLQGDTTNRYWYTIETVETPSPTERR